MTLGKYYLTREIIKSFWFGFLSVCVYFLFSRKTLIILDAVKIGTIAALVFFMLGMIFQLILRLRDFAEAGKIKRIMFEQGITPELLYLVSHRIEKTRTPQDKAATQLILASYLSEGCCYDRAFEILREIDPRQLSDSALEEYFNVYVYTNLMIGDLSAAQGIYDAAKPLFERAAMRRSAMPVLHTLGALEYAKGDYGLAENYFTQALAYAVGKFSRCECEMFLSLCYLKTGRLQQAVSAARAAARDASTVYQRRSIEGLRAQLEEAAANYTTGGQV